MHIFSKALISAATGVVMYTALGAKNTRAYTYWWGTSDGKLITADELERCRDACTKLQTWCLQPSTSINFKLHATLLQTNMENIKINKIKTKPELAMFLANVFHETEGLIYTEERDPAPALGRFYGRGFLQLSTRYNYQLASEALGLGDYLVHHPEKVATDYDLAWKTALWYWSWRVHDRVASGNFEASIDGINPLELAPGATQGQRNQAERRRQFYMAIRGVFGV